MIIRHIFSNKLYLVIKLLGLVLGFTSMFLIGLYLWEEFNYDRFHNNSERIFRVIQVGDYGGIVERSSSCPFPLGPEIDEYYGDTIASYARLYNYQSPVTKISFRNITHYDSGFFFTDPGFFDVFTVDTLTHKSQSLLKSPFEAVITQKAARKYFGHTDVLGKKLKIENQFDVTIAAIVKTWPLHSHFHFSVLVSMSTLTQMRGQGLNNNWVGNPCWTYLKLQTQGLSEKVQKKLPLFVQSHFDESIRDNNTLLLQPLHDIHLTSDLEYEIRQNGNMEYIYVFGGIALFLMLMALINYVNLTTVTFAARAKEIAIKKVLGAFASQLRRQLILESLTITFIAIILSLVFAELLMPWFNGIAQKNFTFSDLFHFRNFVAIITMAVIVTLAGGIYPAFFISALQPARILRGDLKMAGKSGKSRKILVISQLFISTILIFAALTIHQQYRYLTESENGINRDQLLIINARFTGLQKNYNQFKQDLTASSCIMGVTASDYIPGIDHNRHAFLLNRGNNTSTLVFLPALRVMPDFTDVYGIKLIAGRPFGSDSAEAKSAAIINHKMVSYLGFKRPKEALGAPVNTYYGKEHVTGVFKDFYPKTLHNEPEPFIIDLIKDKPEYEMGKQYVAVRYRKAFKEQTIAYIQAELKRYIGRQTYQINEYTKIYKHQYQEEKLFEQLAGIMAVLSVVISIVGLLGLISFLLLQKTKAISIRKVYGASKYCILKFVIAEFIRLYVIVILLAFPVSWYLTRIWMNNFASHTGFSLLNFAISATIIALTIVLVAIFRMQAASGVNAAETLKYE